MEESRKLQEEKQVSLWIQYDIHGNLNLFCRQKLSFNATNFKRRKP